MNVIVNQEDKIKSQEYSKFISDNNTLMTIIYKQCDKATKTEITLGKHVKRIVKMGTLSNSSNEYTQFAFEATTEDYLLGPTNKSYQ